MSNLRVTGMVAWLARPDAKIEAEMDAKFPRIGGELKWDVSSNFFHQVPLPEPEGQPGFFQKAASFISAVTSADLDDAAYAKRIEICKRCPALQTTQDGIFCGACGCGHRSLAELHKKARMSRATCPKKMWP